MPLETDKNPSLNLDVTKIAETIKNAEGFVPIADRDPVGFWTVGYGWNLEARPVSPELAEIILLVQLEEDKKKLFVALPWVTGLSEVRQFVLLEMCFNLGLGGLLGFKNTLSLVKEGKYREAASAMLQSRWAGQVKGRAIRLARSMETNIWG
jgi:lysozyme